MKHNTIYTGLGISFLVILLITLSGCRKEGAPAESFIQNTTLKATMADASWSSAASAEGVPLGLTIDSKDLDAYTVANVPYTLKDGLMVPSWMHITPPDGYPSARLCVYGPYVPSENFNLKSEIGPPPPAIQYPPYITVDLRFGVQTDQRKEGTVSSDLIWGELPQYTGKGGNNRVVLDHKFCKINIKLISELGNDLSQAKVSLVGLFNGGRLKFSNGVFEVSRVEESRSEITVFHNPDGTYQAIIPPQEIRSGTDYIRVQIAATTYNFRLKTPKTLIAGTQYTFDLTVKDKGDLPFTIAVNYDNGKPLGDKLDIAAQPTTYSIGMVEIPNPGESVSFTNLKIRNSTGEPCWAKLYNTVTVVDSERDIIRHEVRYLTIIFEENLSPDPRSMILEFYNTKDPKFVHKRVLIQQAAATRYLDLSSKVLSLDKWGNFYDVPQVLTIRSDRGWTLDNSVPTWVNVQGYTPSNRNQELHITVLENTTGVPREGELRVIVDGTVAATYKITQSVNANPTFTLKYELNLRFNTIENRWHKYDERLGGNLYASKVIVFAQHESSDAAAEIISTANYGFVADAPASYNNLVVNGFRSKYFIHPNYGGGQDLIREVNSAVSGSPTQGAQNFIRQIIFNLPIPANVQRYEMVKYTVEINEIEDSAQHGTPTVTSEIINQ